MFDLDRMKRALASGTVPCLPGVGREIQREWICFVAKERPKLWTVEEMIDHFEDEFPGFKTELEEARKRMEADGTIQRFREAWANPANHIDITDKILDRCIAQEFIANLPPEKRNDPIAISCPCSRCTPKM